MEIELNGIIQDIPDLTRNKLMQLQVKDVLVHKLINKKTNKLLGSMFMQITFIEIAKAIPVIRTRDWNNS